MQVVFANRAHHDFAGIDANPHLEWDTALETGLVAIALHLLLHPQCCVQRSLQMVLMGYRGTEQRKDTIA